MILAPERIWVDALRRRRWLSRIFQHTKEALCFRIAYGNMFTVKSSASQTFVRIDQAVYANPWFCLHGTASSGDISCISGTVVTRIAVAAGRHDANSECVGWKPMHGDAV